MQNKILEHPLKGKITLEEVEETEALVILSSIPQLGTIRVRALLNHYGSARRTLAASALEISAFPNFGGRVSSHWENWPNEMLWKQNLVAVLKFNVTLIPYTSPHYPARLLETPDAPVLLYVQGEMQPVDQRSIAIIGTRHASIYGQEMAHWFACELASYGFTIISGLARGIDTAAHLGALKKGRTIAVIGSGLGDIYPAENRLLSQQIATKGAVISELPVLAPPDRQNFPQRNRIVSGMSKGTLLIEAPIKSGAMITMEKAESQGRPLFVLPGRVDSDSFRGNHALIKQGRARLVESPAEVAKFYDQLFEVKPCVEEPRVQLTSEETGLMNVLPNQEIAIDQILLLVQIPISTLNVLLMKLVLKGYLKEFPGKIFKKKVSLKRSN